MKNKCFMGLLPTLLLSDPLFSLCNFLDYKRAYIYINRLFEIEVFNKLINRSHNTRRPPIKYLSLWNVPKKARIPHSYPRESLENISFLWISIFNPYLLNSIKVCIWKSGLMKIPSFECYSIDLSNFFSYLYRIKFITVTIYIVGKKPNWETYQK